MKIPVFCSLLPVELISSCGAEVDYLSADRIFAGSKHEYSCLLHDNICPYVKGLYDFFLKNNSEYDFIIIPVACDAMKKLYNALMTTSFRKKVSSLDIPRFTDGRAVAYCVSELKKIQAMLGETKNFGFIEQTERSTKNPSIAVIGSNVPMNVVERVVDKNGFDLYYLNHCLKKSFLKADGLQLVKDDPSLNRYAEFHLKKNKCPRSADNNYMHELVETMKNRNVCGLIVQTFKFCDFQPFDYMTIKKMLPEDYPILLLEHEGFSENEGQIMTRIEAFLEKIKGVKPTKPANKERRYYVGVDIGSHATKIVCLDASRGVLLKDVVGTGTMIQKTVNNLLNEVHKKTGAYNRDDYYIIATGYGRNQVADADEIITEITCHAKGVFEKLGKACTIIDIGGQDSKVIRLDDKGNVVRFAMNDKCAAGTGRFLEVISDRLELTLEEFGRLAGQAKDSVAISNMCTVFAESEVISMIAAGHPRENISRGIHEAIAERTCALVRRVGADAPYYMTGGVAKNETLVDMIAEQLKEDVEIMNEPQLNGAYGAALMHLM